MIVTSSASLIGASVATNAAMVTKTATPPTQSAMALITSRFRWVCVTREFRIAVTTSAIAPSGCTTMSGANRRLVSCSSTARPSSTVPITHDGLRMRARSSPTPRPSACCRKRPCASSTRRCASTFVTPRDWNWAPKLRNTAPTSAIGMPMACAEFNETARCSDTARCPTDGARLIAGGTGEPYPARAPQAGSIR